MDLESLKTKVTEAGGTQFSALSQKTVDHLLGREIARNSDDEYYTEDVISGLVEDLKTMDGNLHFEVGKKNTEYKTSFEKKWREEHPETKPTGQEDDKLAKILEKMEAQEKKLQEMEDKRKEAEKNASKNEVLKAVKKSLNEKFEQAGVNANAYILGQTLRDIEIPDENANVAELAKGMEKAYYKNLKEAGLDFDGPRGGGSGGGKGKSAADDYFAKKAKKEGWGKKD